MVLCEKGYLEEYVRKNAHGLAGLEDFYRCMRDVDSGASSNRGPSLRQTRSVPEEVHALRLHVQELEGRHKEDISQITHLERRIAELENPPSNEEAPQGNVVEATGLFEEANLIWAGESSQSLKARERARNEAIQRRGTQTEQQPGAVQRMLGRSPPKRRKPRGRK